MNGEISKNQELHLENREALSLSGVLDILGFEDTNLLVRTELGDLNIDGNDLRVKELSLESGRLLLQGKIDGIYYISSSEKKKGGLFGRKCPEWKRKGDASVVRRVPAAAALGAGGRGGIGATRRRGKARPRGSRRCFMENLPYIIR